MCYVSISWWILPLWGYDCNERMFPLAGKFSHCLSTIKFAYKEFIVTMTICSLKPEFFINILWTQPLPRYDCHERTFPLPSEFRRCHSIIAMRECFHYLVNSAVATVLLPWENVSITWWIQLLCKYDCHERMFPLPSEFRRCHSIIAMRECFHYLVNSAVASVWLPWEDVSITW